MAEKDDYLLDLLVDLGFVTGDQVATARQEASASGVGVVDLLLANKAIRPADVTQAKVPEPIQTSAPMVIIVNISLL